MIKLKRFIGLVLVIASLFGSVGATIVEPFNFEVSEDDTIGSDVVSDETTDTEEIQETEENNTEETDTEEAVTESQDITTLEYKGDTYSVTATYGPETGIPSDCTLKVSEIPEGDVYDEYFDLTSEALENREINSVRFFDICIMKDGIEMEPVQGTSVSVKITLAGSLNEDVSVVHINDDSEAQIISDPQVTDISEGTEVSFSAEAFSAYAIVEGPAATTIQSDWIRVETLDILANLAAQGTEVYFGNPNDNFYITNQTYTVSGTRTGIKKTSDSMDAVPYILESTGTADQYRIYTVISGTPNYLKQTSNSLKYETDPSKATAFNFSDFPGKANEFRALSNNTTYYINQQGGKNGKGFATYGDAATATDVNSELAFWYKDSNSQTVDPYHLDGVSTGLVYYTTGVVGRGLMGQSSGVASLASLDLPVLTKDSNHSEKLFVPDNTDLTMWTFTWVRDDKYNISATVNGATKYLHIDSSGITLSDTAQDIKVVPGTGANAGKIALINGNSAVEYSGSQTIGFDKVSSTSTTSYMWLNLVEETELTDQYVLPYSARKISVSDPSLTDGSKVVVYTRVWDDTQKKYRFYAVDHDGKLIECFEEGDDIKWIGDRINTLLWNFTVYYYEDEDPVFENENHYYELYNEYSEKYIRPNAGSNQALGDSKIGINLNGRSENEYYSTIVAWDDTNYAYAGIKADLSDPNDKKIVSYSYVDGVDAAETVDFYFAVIEEPTYDGSLHTVNTLDHTQYGVTMKIIDFNAEKKAWDKSEQTVFLNSTAGGTGADPTQGLLSTELVDGYPTVTSGPYQGQSLGVLYGEGTDKLREVNHLFIESTYSTSGYFVYDSTQNFASLQSDNNFVVYQELATIDDSRTRPSLQHGQFMPFNDINPTRLANNSPYNLYSALQEELPDSNPRKYENLYGITTNQADYQFGVELETQFVQTPRGLDNWGHDIIYEFTGDDDFWLYVDDELVIDLGGVHSALYGSINYATGEVRIQTTGRAGAPQEGDIETFTLYEIFYNNYKGRGHTDAEAQAYVDGLFQKNERDQYVFKDYTAHKMKIFFMERGGGASNLQMRFNQSSVKPGTVILSKELDGVENAEKFNAEFPYQIWYKEQGRDYFSRLTNSDFHINVVYRGTNKEVKFEHEYEIDGYTYNDVFFLEPGESAEIKMPDDTIEYYIVECGVDPNVYESVVANNVDLTNSGTVPDGAPSTYGRRDYAVDAKPASERTSVTYVNTVDQDALRTLTFTKQLFDESLQNELRNDNTEFSFRLWLATEHEGDNEISLANMYTYHVKNPDGIYCKWDASLQTFTPIRSSPVEFSELTAAEKRSASFTTSMYGSISKIPAFYTVEIPELLAGTRYMVQERYTEIPDGYSRYQYVIYDDVTDSSTATPYSDDTVKTILKDEDPHVDVQNIKGFGIRMYKEWSDDKFVSERENTYFAVYKDGTNGEVLIDDTIYMLKYKKNTLYWYFERLDPGMSLSNYHVREVVLTDPVVDTNTGKVTSYSNITAVGEGQTLTLNGKLKGDTTTSPFTYTVNYDQNPQVIGNNMRIETIKNTRDGVAIYKVDQNDDPIAGAVFTITDNDTNTVIGSFTSDSDGFVTYAYLRKGVDYTLTETKSPSGYAGLKNPLTVTMQNDGSIVVTADPSTASIDQDRFSYNAGPADPSITVKNIQYDFIVNKKDQVTGDPVEGVVFALHKQKTVGSVTVVDFQPIPGYEHLVTDSNGIIPQINSSLAPGTYELREIEAPGYQTLNYFIRFTVTQTGDIKLNAVHPEVIVDEHIEADRVTYTLLISNYPADGDLILSKQVQGNLGNRAEEFEMTVTLTTAADVPYTGSFYTKKNNEPAVKHTLTAADMGVITLMLSHGDTIVFTDLAPGTKFVIEETDAHGYLSKGYLDDSLYSEDGIVRGNTTDNKRVRFVNIRNGLIPTGLETNFSISLGMLTAMAAGLALSLIIARRRRREEE